MKAIIFAGPSLPPSLRPSDPALIWRPPVRQGDLYRATLTHPAIIGVVDGYFESVPTVWHKEILWAMAQGIHVYGSASTGALRAAELAPFGMKGVGRIYEDFRDGVLEDDDEVAVLHGPEELGYPTVTESMVDIRATLAAAVQKGIIEPVLSADLTDIAKGLFYKERTYTLVLEEAARAGHPDPQLCEFATWLRHGRVDQKRVDATGLVWTILTHAATGAPQQQISYNFAETAAAQAARIYANAEPMPPLLTRR
jgi:hypothetical protein